MKILIRIIVIVLGAFALLGALFGIVQTLASERVEVVELHTTDSNGEGVTTRLWIVDHDGYQYLRVGGDGSGWYSRLQANQQISVTRGESTKSYQIETRPDKEDIINELMQNKYTWGDTFFAVVFGGREGSIPIELHEVTTSS
jgi:hypothetical protein